VTGSRRRQTRHSKSWLEPLMGTSRLLVGPEFYYSRDVVLSVHLSVTMHPREIGEDRLPYYFCLFGPLKGGRR
jgi:hypothetical protein